MSFGATVRKHDSVFSARSRASRQSKVGGCNLYLEQMYATKLS